MTRTLMVLPVLAVLAFPAASHAFVTAKFEGNKLVVSGTLLKDNIRVRVVGSTLRVSDTNRVNGSNGCAQDGDEASCPLASVAEVAVSAGFGDDAVTVTPGTAAATLNGDQGDD